MPKRHVIIYVQISNDIHIAPDVLSSWRSLPHGTGAELSKLSRRPCLLISSPRPCLPDTSRETAACMRRKDVKNPGKRHGSTTPVSSRHPRWTAGARCPPRRADLLTWSAPCWHSGRQFNTHSGVPRLERGTPRADPPSTDASDARLRTMPEPAMQARGVQTVVRQGLPCADRVTKPVDTCPPDKSPTISTAAASVLAEPLSAMSPGEGGKRERRT